MKRILFIMLAAVLALGLAVPVVQANSWDGSINWTGQGSGSLRCDKLGEGPRTTDGWIHWVLTSSTGVTAPSCVLGGAGSGTYGIYERHGGTIHFFTPYFDVATLTATVYYNGSLGNNSQFVISDYCPAGGEAEERTSYTRTHNWSIDKAVDTESGYEHEGYPKIWLFVDGSGDETATWTVDVTYEGYEDSDFNVSGTITIENTGNVAANITSVHDLLAGTPIDVDWGSIEFPYVLDVGEILVGTYSVDVESKITGYNTVTVTTETRVYPADPVEIVWGDPTTEVNETVTVVDTSDLFGEVTLGTVTAPNNGQFTYTKNFAWEDYGTEGCGEYTYDNTAEVIGDDEVVLDSDDATLKVNVQCYIYETAYARGDHAICFIPTFANWGWTNPITPGTYEMDLWAAAGQCDTSKGVLVGSVTVSYVGGYVTVNYNVAFPYSLEETHAYAGTTKFPQVKQGKKTVSTVAPGQYYNASPFGGGTVYVIAHAVVGIPDPSFGP
jgi:hypothetical protein